MERPGLLQRGSTPTQRDLPEPEAQGFIGGEDVDYEKKRFVPKLNKTLRLRTPADFWSRPWIGWGFVYITTFLVFSSYRYVAFKDLFRMYSTVIFVGLVAFPALVVALCNACTPLIGYAALNATLNELFAHALQPHSKYSMLKTGQPWVETFIHETEEHTLFGDNSLYRRTTGFHGDLAFDIDVNPENPPNVVVIAVESFRYHDSRYIVGDDDPSNLFKGTDMTITPNFDKWAKRGVTFRNMWSSSPSSRALESLLFAQIPYNNVAKTGITGGKNDTALAGFPQLFAAKGYENYFTTGSLLNYDSWDIFLDSHGFDEVLSYYEIKSIADADYGFTYDMWYGDDQRAFSWGVHDDVAFHVLGDLLVNKTKEQSDRMAQAEPKKPLFLTHYTISSHEPFYRRPKWYADAEKPDFSALYKGYDYEDYVQDYLEMRYFTDMQLGRFMDRMSEEGVLNNTIVVILGDHGRAPEVPNSDSRAESVTRVPSAADLSFANTNDKLRVLEIGPGTGNLTSALLGIDPKIQVHAVEFDRRMVEQLQRRFTSEIEDGSLVVEHSGFEDFKFTLEGEDESRFDACVANIPYQLSSLVVSRLSNYMHRFPTFQCAVLLVQEEFALRLLAQPGNKNYSRLSANTALVADVTSVVPVPRKHFLPPPKVDSRVIKMTPKSTPALPSDKLFFQKFDALLRLCFERKNKTLRALLLAKTARSQYVLKNDALAAGEDKHQAVTERVEAALEACGLSSNRAVKISVVEFMQLMQELHDRDIDLRPSTTRHFQG
ncbi:hypothetical protein BBO99_00009028 [Phytophthora kernoviae]|uniref:Ribosomal RNA adenine methylase transferase N-terminal domain-containing protein n=1 Tax=Phytophthora kernoviae TaxID=325452 RepID=A0A3R7HRN4_9STRA|nr:hypothetical protein BBI17_009020 [Phytophthora kernoviae]RLN74214.1 hypothetical protein BBO99_00009028 [Phytophthora kernoviae]